MPESCSARRWTRSPRSLGSLGCSFPGLPTTASCTLTATPPEEVPVAHVDPAKVELLRENSAQLRAGGLAQSSAGRGHRQVRC